MDLRNDWDDCKPKDIIVRPFVCADTQDAFRIIAASTMYAHSRIDGRGPKLLAALPDLAFNQNDMQLYSVILRGGKLGGVMIHDTSHAARRFTLYPTTDPLTHIPAMGGRGPGVVTQTQVMLAMLDSAVLLTQAGVNGKPGSLYITVPRGYKNETDFDEKLHAMGAVSFDALPMPTLWGGVGEFSYHYVSGHHVPEFKAALHTTRKAVDHYTP
jgi:hypothetical protein